ANFFGALVWVTTLAHLTISAHFLLVNLSTKSTGLIGSSFSIVGVGWAGGLSSFFFSTAFESLIYLLPCFECLMYNTFYSNHFRAGFSPGCVDLCIASVKIT
ncbi:hypothetical protein GIB67_038604, partial [Kingdonia uniflora]